MTTTSAGRATESPSVPQEHVVLLYDSEQALATSVVSFLRPGLLNEEALLVVATPGHRRLFSAALTRAGADLTPLRREGRYVELDAESTLRSFLPDGRLSRLGFQSTVGRQVRLLSRSHGRVHIYGEMVACLWGRGDADAALGLEDLWNDLAHQEDFRLCCAYHRSLLGSEDFRVDDMLSAHSVSTWLNP